MAIAATATWLICSLATRPVAVSRVSTSAAPCWVPMTRDTPSAIPFS